MFLLNEFLNKQPKNTTEYSYLDKIRQDFEKAYNSNENNDFSDVIKNSDILEKESKIEYNSIAEAIEDDTRKKKFLNHSNSVNYFNLDYDVMDEINAIVSAKAHKSINGNVVNFTQLIESDYKIYNIYADILEDDYYYINNAEELRKEVENDVNERIKKQNNGLPVRNSTNEQREFITNTESVINTRTNTKLSELSRGQQRGFNNQSINKKVTRDSRKNLNVKNSKELDNSSFSLDKLPKVKDAIFLHRNF